MGIAQCLSHLHTDGKHLIHGQQLFFTNVLIKTVAGNIIHGDISEIMLLADIINGHNIGVIETPSGFRLLKKAPTHVFQLFAFKFLSERHGFDGYSATNAWITPQIHGAHGSTAQFAFDFIATQHRTLHFGVIHHQSGRGIRNRSGRQRYRFQFWLMPRPAFTDITEIIILFSNVIVSNQRFVKLTTTLKIQA